jgi:hypothetical protein
MIAMALGQSPALFMDNYAKALLRWAQGHQGQNGNGQRQRVQQQIPRQRQPQSGVSQNVHLARQATMSGAVGAPPSSGAVSSTTLTASDLLSRRLTDKDITAGIKQFGSLDKYMRHLETVAVELEQIL